MWPLWSLPRSPCVGKISRDIGQTQVGGTSVDGAAWSSWAKGPVSMLHDSMIL